MHLTNSSKRDQLRCQVNHSSQPRNAPEKNGFEYIQAIKPCSVKRQAEPICQRNQKRRLMSSNTFTKFQIKVMMLQQAILGGDFLGLREYQTWIPQCINRNPRSLIELNSQRCLPTLMHCWSRIEWASIRGNRISNPAPSGLTSSWIADPKANSGEKFEHLD